MSIDCNNVLHQEHKAFGALAEGIYDQRMRAGSSGGLALRGDNVRVSIIPAQGTSPSVLVHETDTATDTLFVACPSDGLYHVIDGRHRMTPEEAPRATGTQLEHVEQRMSYLGGQVMRGLIA